MYVEGKCSAIDMCRQVAEHIKSARKANGEPMWEMVSSNVGVRNKTQEDDGWVFRSKGANGRQNIIIRITNGWYHNTLNYHWLWGNMVSVASDYIPGEEGKNGKFINERNDCVQVFYDPNFNGYTESSLPMRYYLSITEERVIFAYNTDVVHSYARKNIIFMGRPHVIQNEDDPGVILATAMSYTNRDYSSLMLVNSVSAKDYGTTALTARATVHPKTIGWGNRIYPSNIFMHYGYQGRGGVYGVLDIMVASVDGSIRPIDSVKVGDIEYLAMQIPYVQYIYNSAANTNNFMPTGVSSQDYIYMFPKI